MRCPECRAVDSGKYLGKLGTRTWVRCQDCHTDFTVPNEEVEDIFADIEHPNA